VSRGDDRPGTNWPRIVRNVVLGLVALLAAWRFLEDAWYAHRALQRKAQREAAAQDR